MRMRHHKDDSCQLFFLPRLSPSGSSSKVNTNSTSVSLEKLRLPPILGVGWSGNNEFDDSNGKRLEDGAERAPVAPDTQSQVYVRDIRNEGRLLLVSFVAEDVRMDPAYLKPRVFEERPTDKNVQPRSEAIYSNVFSIHSSKMNMLEKQYQLDKRSDRLSIMSTRRPLGTRRIREEPRPPKVCGVSDTKSTIGKSAVRLLCDGVLYTLNPGVLDLKASRSDSGDTESGKQLLHELGMESTEGSHNRAQMVVRHKADVLKFTFSLTSVNCVRVNERVSQGVQAADDSIYIRGFSDVTDRVVYYPIPRSTYLWRDPMIDVQKRNMNLKLSKMEPRWLAETRRQRLADYRRCRVEKDPYKDLLELRQGCSLNYHSGGSHNRAKTDSVASLSVSEHEYEEWVCDQQRIDYTSLGAGTGRPGGAEDRGNGGTSAGGGAYAEDEDGPQRFETDLDQPIPDWDLVLHNS